MRAAESKDLGRWRWLSLPALLLWSSLGEMVHGKPIVRVIEVPASHPSNGLCRRFGMEVPRLKSCSKEAVLSARAGSSSLRALHLHPHHCFPRRGIDVRSALKKKYHEPGPPSERGLVVLPGTRARSRFDEATDLADGRRAFAMQCDRSSRTCLALRLSQGSDGLPERLREPWRVAMSPLGGAMMRVVSRLVETKAATPVAIRRLHRPSR